jgi:CDP-diacylglycerol--glycerol-3-phosphate 3-phosphatidyltransferase
VSALADVASVTRLAAAAAFPAAFAQAVGQERCIWFPAVLFGVAAATDFVDGPLARRHGGGTRHGAVLDNVADIAFVLGASATGATLGLVPWIAPLAIALAFTSYALASAGYGRPARSAAGHAAGVVNYVLAGLLAGSVLVPDAGVGPALRVAGFTTAGINLVAVLGRFAVWRTAGS